MNNPNQINLGNGFVAIYNDDREWIYKAVPFVPKRHIAEEPQYKVINDIERRYQKDFDRCLVAVVKDIARYLV